MTIIRHPLASFWTFPLLLAVLVAGCAQDRDPEEMKNTLVYGFSDNFKTFDPARAIYANESAIITQVHETMLRWNSDQQLVPHLARDYETNEACTEWTFYLRPDVFFSDGTEFTSEAVKLTLDRIKDPETAATRSHLMNEVTEIEARDKLTVVFHLSEPNCVFHERMAHTFSSIPSPEALRGTIDETGPPIASHPVGTGPYMLEEWDRDRMILRFKRNPAYWGGGDYIENVVMRQVRENTTRLILLEQGVLDMAFLSDAHVNVAKNTDDIVVQSSPRLASVYMGFNTQKPPFDDVRVRQAANYAIDRESMIKYVFFGVGEPAKGVFPDLLPAFNHDMKTYGYDPEKARALMDEAGYGDGVDVTMWTMEQGAYNKLAIAVIDSLRDVGIRVNVQIYDNAAYWDQFDEYQKPTGEWYPRKEGVFDLFVGGWAGGESPMGFLEPLFKSNSYSNASFYSNPDYDELIAKVKAEPDPEKRTEIFREMQAILLEDAPWIFSYHSQLNLGIRQRVKDFEINAGGWLFFDGVRLADQDEVAMQ